MATYSRLMTAFRDIALIKNETLPPEKRRKPELISEAYEFIDHHKMNLLNMEGAGSAMITDLGEAMTTADFPYALGEFVDRELWPRYQRFGFGFEPLVFNDTVPNFLTVTRYQKQAGLDDLEMVNEKGRAYVGYQPDAAKRQYKVYRWEKVFDFSMEAIVNDDLGYFGDMAGRMGEAARRTLEKFVSRLYNNATTIAGLTALGATYFGTGRLSTNNLMIAWAAFNGRSDARGEPIQANPVYLVIPRALLPTATQILASVQVAENATNARNVLPPLTVIQDPYLTGTAPNYPWFMFSAPDTSGIRTVTLARMQGRPRPYVLQKAPDTMTFTGFGQGGGTIFGLGDFETGNIKLKVADVWGGWADTTYAGVTDYRGVYYSNGTTP